MKVDPSPVAFGSVVVGSKPPTRSVTVTNAGERSLAIGVQPPSQDFRIDSNGCTTALEPGHHHQERRLAGA